MKKNRRDTVRAVALAGIGGAISLAAAAMSVYIPLLRVSFSVLSGAGIMLPLAKGYTREGILAYIAVSLISLAFGPLKVLQFITLFGLYPLIIYLLHFKLKEKVNRRLVFYTAAWVFKLVYFNLIAWMLITVLGIDLTAVEIFDRTYALWAVIIVGNLLFVLYDLAVLNIYKTVKYYADKNFRKK